MKTSFFKFAFKRRGFTFLAIGLWMSLAVFAQTLPTATQVASQMKVGWNLGNTLEAICGENAWGNPTTTQALISAVKNAGFNTVRLPVAWDCHSTNNVIDTDWLARVKAVVDYCMNADLYVIINIHWDGGWLENNVTTAAQASVNAKQQAYWTQIANNFIDYDERVLFASANEPNVDDATGMSVLLSYHQTFINAVRATGGNNSSRTLIIQGPSTDIEKTNNLMNTMPTDQIADRLMVEVHYYTPYQFCLMTEDASWGNMFYYWGNGYHSTVEPSRNATWGEESEVERLFGYMKTKFVDNGIPVIIGECLAIKRTTPAELALHLASRNYFHEYIVSSSTSKGMIPVYWDTGGSDCAIFDRNTGGVVDQETLNAIMEGAGGNPGQDYSLTVSITGSGSVTSDPSGTTFPSGTSVTLTAVAAAEYEFAGWSGDVSGTSNPVSILMNANKTVTANFVPEGTVTGCINPETISIPFTFDGAGDYCWFTSTAMSYINSWNMAELTINGVNYTNTWSNNLPEATNGGWTIHYVGNYAWSHFEAPQAKGVTEKNTGKAIDEIADEILVYPNPAYDILTISFTGPNDQTEVAIYNPFGSLVQSVLLDSSTQNVDISGFNSGLYVVKLTYNTKTVTRKFIKR